MWEDAGAGIRPRGPGMAGATNWKQISNLPQRGQELQDVGERDQGGSPKMDLKSHATVAEYFYEVVTEAIRNQGVDTSQTAEYYLVNLLAAYTKAPVDDEPLGLKAASAVL